MDLEAVVEGIDRQAWLDRVGTGLQAFAKRAPGRGGTLRRRVKNALHGTWLEHPLHPALTDIPLGAWTVAVILDAVAAASPSPWRGRGFARAADAAVAIGLSGAIGAIATGLNDWQHTDYGPRRTGVAHGLLNTTATLLQGASLALRRAGARRGARALTIAGYGVSLSAAYLGGHLVFGDRIGVDHTSGQEPPREFLRVLAERDLAEGDLRRVDAGGMPVLLARTDGQIHALAETCTHLGGPLSEGKREGAAVVCPWHASRFDLRNGRVLDGPATFPLPCLEVRVRDGGIEVRGRPRP